MAEEKWIAHYNTRNPDFGYNLQKGGAHAPHPIRNPWDRPEYREKCVKSLKALGNDPAVKAKRSAKAKDLWSDPDYRDRVVSSSQAVTRSDEFSSRHSEVMKSALASPEARERMSRVAKERAKDPVFLKKLRASWSDPAFRERCEPALRERNARESSKTHCKNGHLYTDDTVVIGSRGGRECGLCISIRRRAARTHCPDGHEYLPKTTLVMRSGVRTCLLCRASRKSTKCSKCGGSKLRKSGGRFRCGPCTDARVAFWRESRQ